MKRQSEYEEFLKEKLMIDEIVRKIYEEDQRYVRNVRLIQTLSIYLSVCQIICDSWIFNH